MLPAVNRVLYLLTSAGGGVSSAGPRRDVLVLCLFFPLDLRVLCLGLLGSVVPARSAAGSCPDGPYGRIGVARSCPRLGQAADNSEALMAEAAMVGNGRLVGCAGNVVADAGTVGAGSLGCCGGTLPSCFLDCGVGRCSSWKTSASVLPLSLGFSQWHSSRVLLAWFLPVGRHTYPLCIEYFSHTAF